MPSKTPIKIEESIDAAANVLFNTMIPVREIKNQAIISNVCHLEGYPAIESVQSGATTFNSTRRPIELSRTVQILDQVTLCVQDDKRTSLSPPTESPSDSTKINKMTTILKNRGITVKSTSKKENVISKTRNSQAEAAIQKLQKNKSVSITSRKTRAIASRPLPVSVPIDKANDTIDLSSDDEAPETSSASDEAPVQRPRNLVCPIKKCRTKFSTVKALRDHTAQVHRQTRLRCTKCSARFTSTDAIKKHIQTMHADQVNVKSEFAIPLLNFNDPNIRKKMQALGFTNFLPLANVREEKTDVFGIPVINIDGPSLNNLKNLFEMDAMKVMPISAMQTIPSPNFPKFAPPSQSTPISSIHLPENMFKLLSPDSSASTHLTKS